jgi:hypothetical protein
MRSRAPLALEDDETARLWETVAEAQVTGLGLAQAGLEQHG